MKQVIQLLSADGPRIFVRLLVSAYLGGKINVLSVTRSNYGISEELPT